MALKSICRRPIDRNLKLKKQTLHEELAIVDEALAALEERRTNIVHRMMAQISPDTGSSNLLPFPKPTRITVRPTRSLEWPIGTAD